MKKRNLRWLLVVFVLVGVFTMIGMLRSPKPLQSILPEETETSEMFAVVNISRIEDGMPYIDFYNMSNVSSDSEEYKEIMKIMESTEYSNDLRNYLPWETELSGGKSETDIVGLYILFRDESGDGFSMMFGTDKVVVSKNNSDDKDMIYHMTENQIFTELAEYIKKNGILAQ